MSNAYNSNPIIIDTPGAAIIDSITRDITKIMWVGPTTAAHTAVVQDAAGNPLVTMKASATPSADIIRDFGDKGKPVVGLKVPTLGSGFLEIHHGNKHI